MKLRDPELLVEIRSSLEAPPNDDKDKYAWKVEAEESISSSLFAGQVTDERTTKEESRYIRALVQMRDAGRGMLYWAGGLRSKMELISSSTRNLPNATSMVGTKRSEDVNPAGQRASKKSQTGGNQGSQLEADGYEVVTSLTPFGRVRAGLHD